MSLSAAPSGRDTPAFLAKQHILFALRHAKYLPTPYQAEDNNRMTLAYFCLASLAILPSSAVSSTDPSLSALQAMLKPAQIHGFRDWVYEQQMPSGGFRGSDSLAAAAPCEADHANVIQTYTALSVLGLLGDDYERLDRDGLKQFLQACQNEDGSFSQFPGCEEPGDPRSTYSAFAVASMLDEWDFLDVEQGLAFLECCRSYEGAYAQRPGLEANAGPTYCAVASYSLASRLHTISEPERLLRWLVDRQVEPPKPTPSEIDSESDTESESQEKTSGGAVTMQVERSAASGISDTSSARRVEPTSRRTTVDVAGFQGRANKPTDACYSFWNTAALTILIPSISPKLSLPDLVDPALDREWLLSCQHTVFGGIARERKAPPDVHHTYLSLAALSLGDFKDGALGLRHLDPAWNVPVEVAARMRAHLWQDAT
ncbi:hypothetical protein JCM10908_000595 [Rhodotorula pacifica]|uniref:uncharacterized protein n=1 Tax=Rhodotorula pacifica TaxID=1495444 RepID=UPI00317F7D2F